MKKSMIKMSQIFKSIENNTECNHSITIINRDGMKVCAQCGEVIEKIVFSDQISHSDQFMSAYVQIKRQRTLIGETDLCGRNRGFFERVKNLHLDEDRGVIVAREQVYSDALNDFESTLSLSEITLPKWIKNDFVRFFKKVGRKNLFIRGNARNMTYILFCLITTRVHRLQIPFNALIPSCFDKDEFVRIFKRYEKLLTRNIPEIPTYIKTNYYVVLESASWNLGFSKSRIDYAKEVLSAIKKKYKTIKMSDVAVSLYIAAHTNINSKILMINYKKIAEELKISETTIIGNMKNRIYSIYNKSDISYYDEKIKRKSFKLYFFKK